MGKQLFLPRSLDNNGGNLVDLSAGQIAVVKAGATTTLTTAAALAGIAATEKMQIVWRHYNEDDFVDSTPPFSMKEVKSLSNIIYNVGVSAAKQVTTIAITLPSNKLVGDTHTIKVVNTTPGTASLTKKSWTYVATSASYSLQDVCDWFTANIGLSLGTAGTDAEVGVVCTDDNTTITLTGTTYFNHFRVAYEGDGTATITYVTDLVPATGTHDQIVDFEEAMKSRGQGITNTLVFPKTFVSEVQAATNYDMLVLELELSTSAKHGMSPYNVEKHTIYIAEPTGSNVFSDEFTAAWGYWNNIDATGA